MSLDDDLSDLLKPKRNKHICLPRGLLDELKSDPDLRFDESMIHHIDEMSLGTRDDLLKCYVIGERDHFMTAGDNWDDEQEGDWSMRSQFYPGSNSTFLHFAAKLGDVPFVHECIRLGVHVDVRDAKGKTPLHFAVHEIIRFHYDLVERQRLGSDTSVTIAHLKRLRRVVKVLLEQHADVHIIPHGEHNPPVHLAWYALDLELLELFALHGASEIVALPVDIDIHSGRAPLWVANTAKIPLLRQLLARLARDGLPPRPPRLCPCWSGKPLSECHESGHHPYPHFFPCVCGKSKTYAKCCKRRNFEILENWDAERKRLTVVRRVRDGDAVIYQNPHSLARTITSLKDEDMEEEEKLVEMAIGLNDRVSEKKADPAFRYALLKYRALPQPMNKRYEKHLLITLHENWNAAIDEYIALGTDQRSILEIEQAAKLDCDLGPLWKSCEAPECAAVERPGLKMKCCSACKTTYYCSAKCQKAGWKAHKAECKDAKPQALRSQVIYSAILNEVVRPFHMERQLLDLLEDSL